MFDTVVAMPDMHLVVAFQIFMPHLIAGNGSGLMAVFFYEAFNVGVNDANGTQLITIFLISEIDVFGHFLHLEFTPETPFVVCLKFVLRIKGACAATTNMVHICLR